MTAEQNSNNHICYICVYMVSIHVEELLSLIQFEIVLIKERILHIIRKTAKRHSLIFIPVYCFNLFGTKLCNIHVINVNMLNDMSCHVQLLDI